MAVQNNRGIFLFGLTLTELAFILFFILLFFSILEINEKVTENAIIIEEIDAYKKVFETIPEFKEKSLEEKNQWLKELVEKSTLSTEHQKLVEKHKVLIEKLVANKKIIEDIKKLHDVSPETFLKERKENITLKEELEQKAEQVVNLQKQVIGLGGHIYPPCWKDIKTEKAEYIYDIILGENGISTQSGYRKYREKEFLQILGSKDIVGTTDISIREFKEKTSGVFNWSVKKAKPECRHYVRIFDETRSKRAYKMPLLGIEEYFYKYQYSISYSEYQKKLNSITNGVNITLRDKTNIGSSKSVLKQFSKKDCEDGDRKSMPMLWRKLCERLKRDGSLEKNYKPYGQHIDPNETKESNLGLIEQLQKLKTP